MNRISIHIKQIDNGWLLSVFGCGVQEGAPEDKYFETLEKALEYLKTNNHVFTGEK